MSTPYGRKIRYAILAALTLFAVTLVPMTASAVPHPGHEQPPRGNGPADPGRGGGRGNPNGNNGTIKIDGVATDGTFDGHPNNEPHVGCPFEVDLYGFDSEENGDTARLVFRHWPPTGGKEEIDADGFAVDQPGIDLPPVTEDGNHLIVPIDHDGAGGGVDIDREVRTFLDLPDSGAHPQHGFHVRLDAQITSAGRQYKKTKVFWVTECLDPKIDIEKFVNGHDADEPPGPAFESGLDATFTYVVTNTGDTALTDVVAIDNVVGRLTCPRSSLGIGDSMECDPTTMPVEYGQNFMEACVEAVHGGVVVSDCDPVHYTGEKESDPARIGDHVSYQYSGVGAADVKIDLYEADNGRRGRFAGTMRTDGNGDYGFRVPAGCYVLVFIAPDGWEWVGRNRHLELSTCVGSGETDNSLDGVLRRLP